MSDGLQPGGLFEEVRQLIDTAKQRAAIAVNAELTLLYWHIGKRIQAEVLQGQRAEYGKQVLLRLSAQLTQTYGRGWGDRHLRNCLRFAEQFPDLEIVNTVCSKLSWSHFRVLSSIDDPLKRDFYIEITQLEKWSVRQLRERLDSMLYERTALSRKPEETIRSDLTRLREEQTLSPDLLLRDPYVLDFLELSDRYTERDLEDAILREIERFLLEMGDGFTFVSRQKRLQIDDDDFYIDLLFYNRKLKRLVAIDLKLGNFRSTRARWSCICAGSAATTKNPTRSPPSVSFSALARSRSRLSCWNWTRAVSMWRNT